MKAERNIRQSQLIGPWGIGHIMDFPNDESLVIAGLDAWDAVYQSARGGIHEFIIKDARLQRRLGVSHFRLPPDYRDRDSDQQNYGLEIPFIRFPLWHYCPWCGYMEKIGPYQPRRLQCTAPDYKNRRKCTGSFKTFMIPTRFIAVCEDGHLHDFPYLRWVHGDQPVETNCKLRWMEGSTTELADIWIRCNCGKSRSMGQVFEKKSLSNIEKCNGKRVWLGETDGGSHPCNSDMIVLQKGATNVYFTLTKSSIYLPDGMRMQEFGDVLRNNPNLTELINGKPDIEYIRLIAGRNSIDADKLLAYIKQEIGIVDITDEDVQVEEINEDDFRIAEYEAIVSGKSANRDDLSIKLAGIGEYNNLINDNFANIRLVHRLKETRAFYGFSRAVYDPKNIPAKKKNLSIKSKNWLPAVWYRGEGIFLEFDDNKLKKWQSEKRIQERCIPIIQRYADFKVPEFELNAGFILIHSFAHMMINELIYQCGYGSSSLKERIYYKPGKMTGVLIYTASGDSEGSMGGLVRLGYPGKLEPVLTLALEKTGWCSSDPICISSEGQGPDSCNLAACHNCLLLPETSCEFGNRLLDRALICGHSEEGIKGYFN